METSGAGGHRNGSGPSGTSRRGSPDSELCPSCFEWVEASATCPCCGWKPGEKPSSDGELAPGAVLRGRYRIGRVIGRGGFGITYLGWDTKLERKRAVKEYFPKGVVTRLGTQTRVSVVSGQTELYSDGIQKYLDEARLLAQFERHPCIVSPLDFFEENETAYLVMEYLEGETLRSYVVNQGGRIPYAHALHFLTPVIEALATLHREGILHRDVSPDNIFLTVQGEAKLLDFGAARERRVGDSAGMTVILRENYAPPEQYTKNARQGAWTDVYALGATFYMALTGESPPPSPERMLDDRIRRPSELGVQIPPLAEETLMRSLAVRIEDRCQEILDLLPGLRGDASGAKHQDRVADPGPPRPPVHRQAAVALSRLAQKVSDTARVASSAGLARVRGIALAVSSAVGQGSRSVVGTFRASGRIVWLAAIAAICVAAVGVAAFVGPPWRTASEDGSGSGAQVVQSDPNPDSPVAPKPNDSSSDLDAAGVLGATSIGPSQGDAAMAGSSESSDRSGADLEAGLGPDEQSPETPGADGVSPNASPLPGTGTASLPENQVPGTPGADSVTGLRDAVALQDESTGTPGDPSAAAASTGVDGGSGSATPLPEDGNAAVDLPGLVVRSRLVGDQLFIDGKPMGSTSRSVHRLSPGRHAIRVTKSGYLDYEEQVELAPGESQELWATMRPDPAARREQITTARRLLGSGSASERKRGLEALRELGTGGEAAAQAELGVLYAYGKPGLISGDDRSALGWYRKAAEQGVVEAQYTLGRRLEEGTWPPKGETHAPPPKARKGLLNRVFGGVFGERPEKAFLDDLFGNQTAGDPTDLPEAFKWHQRAAKKGYPGAQERLGFMYAGGRGVKLNRFEAFEWFLKAARQGLADAQYTVGMCYLVGEGRRAIPETASCWLHKAAAQGHEDARKQLERMKYELPKGTSWDRAPERCDEPD